MITREDVMSYSAMGAVTATILSGLAYDSKMMGIMWSMGVIAVGCVGALITAYLHTSQKG